MKLLRYGPRGAEKPGLLARDGSVRCLSSVVRDIDGFALSDPALKMIAGIDPNTLPKVDANVRLGSCVARPTRLSSQPKGCHHFRRSIFATLSRSTPTRGCHAIPSAG